MRNLLGLTLIAMLAACTAERSPPAGANGVSPPPVPTVADEDPKPAPPPDGADAQASFAGYGDIKFGIAADGMEAAWGGKLKELEKQANASCYFMTPIWVTSPAEFNFMIEAGKFARFGTESAKYVAPGGGKIGMTKAEIAALYAGRIQEQPHQYTDGQYLRIKDPEGGSGVLVFETDGKGDGAKVTEWRVGVAPQVDYVEGCS